MGTDTELRSKIMSIPVVWVQDRLTPTEDTGIFVPVWAAERRKTTRHLGNGACVFEFPEGGKNGLDTSKATMAESLADSAEDVSLQGQETKWTPKKINLKSPHQDVGLNL